MCCAEVSDSSVNHLCLSVKETSDSLWMTQKLVESLNSIHQMITDSLTLSLSLSLFTHKHTHSVRVYTNTITHTHTHTLTYTHTHSHTHTNTMAFFLGPLHTTASSRLASKKAIVITVVCVCVCVCEREGAPDDPKGQRTQCKKKD